MNDDELTIRPISGPEELGLFCELPYEFNEELADDLAAGRRRTEWLWVALRGGRPLARAAWWARGPQDRSPLLLDVFDLAENGGAGSPDRVETGVRLLETALARVDPGGSRSFGYNRLLPPHWREEAAVRRGVEDRVAALERTGARILVERLRLQWQPGTPVAAPTGRLAFRPAHDTAELLSLMTAALDGTLDAHSREDLARMPARQAAVRHYEDELARYTSPRAWWRIATLPDGEPVGFVVPARNDYNPVIAYLAVLPAHRGNGFVDEILAEGTRVLAAEGVPRVRAATDLGNVPMADAFARAGYAAFQRTLNMTWT